METINSNIPEHGPILEDEGKLLLSRKAGKLGRLIHRYYMEAGRARGAGVDPLRGQGRVLALLAAKPETTQRELSYLLDMRQQSLSELLAKLEEKGYVERSRSEEDGRVTVVRLTEAGAAAAPDVNQMSRHDDALDCLDEGERKEFERLLDKATLALEGKLEVLGIDSNDRPRGPRGPRGGRGPRPEGPFGYGPGGHHGPYGKDRDGGLFPHERPGHGPGVHRN